MTIGELRDELDDWPESFEIIFGCPELEFIKIPKRGSGMSMNRLSNSRITF
jgi:hypothetical protein